MYLGTAGGSVWRKNLQDVAVGVLDEVDAVGQFIKDQPHGLVLGLQALEVLGHEGHMGGVIPQAVGLGPLELPAELQLERGDTVAQEDQCQPRSSMVSSR